MPNPPSGRELDRLLAISLTGEDRPNPPAYSTDANLCSRLASRLRRGGVAVEIEEAHGQTYATLRKDGQCIGTGSGESSPLALARAVLNSKFALAATSDPSRERPRRKPPNLPGYARAASYCSECGIEVKRLRVGPKEGLLCNLCNWKRVKSQTLLPRKPRLPAS